ncbi:cytochrome C [Pseudomethylobacillus aquaticus]|uniref:Cytochrome C n=1 Tax=Pseudomethylobacillus aquaticus TaxID=2676064 RepID=A0A3N0UU43_9PROT|nr:c-type cytochrome [Pseudomethylobacillus aquaticus]ROH84089.1 cytochrome C [Pseudomethylobacillus aquaticus]
MQTTRTLISVLLITMLAACGDKDASGSAGTASSEKKADAGSSSGQCALVSTKDGSPLPIKAVDTDTPEAKEFLATCINPYTKLYAADAEMAKAGKKKFGYYSCTQCHGPNGDGQVAVAITDARWQYAKHTTDKGMFETIAGGSNGGMFAWHQQVSGPEYVPTDDILKIIAFLRTQYKGGGDTPWLN